VPALTAGQVLSGTLDVCAGELLLVRRLGTLPLIHQPGKKWMYSTGADVLGVLIARAYGQPFETFLRQRIFEPLGMTDTGFAVPAAQLGRLAAGYWPDPATGALMWS
jgi:CubicO group peptidase (beta-lactamase class C family)